MAKKIFCKKLNKELTALSMPPMPGPKGLEIMNSISEEAWELWKSHQTFAPFILPVCHIHSFAK